MCRGGKFAASIVALLRHRLAFEQGHPSLRERKGVANKLLLTCGTWIVRFIMTLWIDVLEQHRWLTGSFSISMS